MPAIASALVHVSPETGIRMADFGLRGDEDFLLIHGVTDRAEYNDERKVFDLDGNKLYHSLVDPELTVSFDADCLAFEGLANLHPGQNIGLSLLKNVISGSFGFDLSSTPRLMYRRPVRTRKAGNIASINFDIVVSNAALGTGYQTPLSSWPGGATPGNTLYNSTTPAPSPAPSLFGSTVFWRRKADLTSVLGTVSSVIGFGPAAAVTHYYQGYPDSSTPVADYAAFLASPDVFPTTTLQSAIVEAYSVVDGTNWFLGGGATPRIPGFLVSNNDPRLSNFDDDGPTARYVAKWAHGPSGTDYAEVYMDDFADLAAFQAAHPNDADNTLMMLYDAKSCTFPY